MVKLRLQCCLSYTYKMVASELGGAAYTVSLDSETSQYQVQLTTQTLDKDEEKLKMDLVDFLGGLQNLLKDEIKKLHL